jgi:hypothetical protein
MQENQQAILRRIGEHASLRQITTGHSPGLLRPAAVLLHHRATEAFKIPEVDFGANVPI